MTSPQPVSTPPPPPAAGAQPPAVPPELPRWARVGLLLTGFGLVLVGIAGLILPVLQGIPALFLAAAVLSISSRTADRFVRRTLSPWPRLWARMERLQLWLLVRLTRRRPAP